MVFRKQIADKQYPYRVRIAKQPSVKRIKKVQNKSLKDFGVLRTYITLLFMPASVKSAYRYLDVVIRKFFIVQYLEKAHIAHIPVRHVDHELDEKVPFDPDYLDTYLGFVNFFLRPMAMLSKRYGMKEGSKIGSEYLRYIKKAYSEAYRLYSYTMTTTYRPYCDDRRIRKMRKADPHFLCVPSLHIAIIFLTCGFFDMVFDREGFTIQEKEKWTKELYEEAIAIGESVLYVKQHSVNCIPAALYMMTCTCPELFTVEYTLNFIDNMFRHADDISLEDCEKIRNHINITFLRFYNSDSTTQDWTIAVKKWLDGYHSYEPFYAMHKQRHLYGKFVRYVRRKQYIVRKKLVG